MFVVWKCHEVKGVYSTLELAKKAAEAKARYPEEYEYITEWEDEGNGEWSLWVKSEDHPEDDVMYIQECVVDA